MKIRRYAITLLGAVLAFGGVLSGCGGKGTSNGVTITFWGDTNQYTHAYYRQLSDTYNETQGVTDGVTVDYSAKGTDYGSTLSTTLSGSNPPDVVIISDKYFKNYADQNFFVDLNTFMANEALTTKNAAGEVNFDLSDLSADSVNRYRFDVATKTAQDPSSALYALPNGSNPTFLLYNKNYFEAANINVISVDEGDLEAYNEANGTSYLPGGYCEYLPEHAPAHGLKTADNLGGETVIKVFNNRIAMNWTQMRTLAMYFTKEYTASSPSQYGFLSEWWFAHGWSVGGDCIDWDEEKGQYVFTLGSELANYLVTKDVTVNETAYSAGELLRYSEKKYAAANAEAIAALVNDGSLYELPSQYDAFAEFCALSKEKDGSVDRKGNKGYGISPTPETMAASSNENYFTSGRVAMAVLAYVNANSVNKAIPGTWEAAPLICWRAYAGGDADENGRLKVIGKEYGGERYTGEVLYVGETPVVGKPSGSSLNNGLCIPSNSKHHESAWKFIQWVAGREGQTLLAQANSLIPNQISYAQSAQFLESDDRLSENTYAIAKAATYCTVGDWAYLEDGEWVTDWSDTLNTDVRNGTMMLNRFFTEKPAAVDAVLATKKIRILK